MAGAIKKHYNEIAYALALAISILAHTVEAQKIQLEVFTGVAITSINSSAEYSNEFGQLQFKYVIKVPVGVNVDFSLSQNLLIETGVIYNGRGSRVYATSYGLFGGSAQGNLNIGYIDIPLLLVLSPSNYRIFLGPQLSIRTAADFDGNDISQDVEENDYGIRYGIGTDRGPFTFRFIGQNGFSDVFKDAKEEWRSSSYTISVGYCLIKMNRRHTKSKHDDIIPDHRKLEF